jgi:hypothetical protein
MLHESKALKHGHCRVKTSSAVEHSMPIPTDASKNMLLGYHYALRQQSKQLARERSEIQKGKMQPLQQAHLFTKHAATHHTQITKGTAGTDQGLKTSNTQKGKAFPNTPEAALVAAKTYLYTTRPSPGDPREYMHRAALQGLRMVGNKLIAIEEVAYHNKGTHKPRSPRRHNSPRHRSGSLRSRSPSPRHHKSPKHE